MSHQNLTSRRPPARPFTTQLWTGAENDNPPNIWRNTKRPIVRSIACVLTVLIGMITGALCNRAQAAEAISGTARVSDGDTIVIDGIRVRFDGIDAPETDQPCLEENGGSYHCGIEARQALEALIGGRMVRCDDLGQDTSYRTSKRRIGHCFVGDGAERIDINHRMVRDGWAVNFEPYGKGQYVADEENARTNRRGMWKGCFSRPQEFRHWSKRRSQPLGLSCHTDAKDKLFPVPLTMPSGCEVKGTLTFRASPYRGIYHLPDAGCRSYQRATSNRWFCSEQDAKDAGFRRAYNCRAKGDCRPFN